MKSVRPSDVPGSDIPLSYSPNSLIFTPQGNVLISPEGEPLLTDFGISHMLSSSSIMSLATGTYGTMRWMAYEQINVEDGQATTPYTFQTDVWSFGMTVLVRLSLSLPSRTVQYV